MGFFDTPLSKMEHSEVVPSPESNVALRSTKTEIVGLLIKDLSGSKA